MKTARNLLAILGGLLLLFGALHVAGRAASGLVEADRFDSRRAESFGRLRLTGARLDLVEAAVRFDAGRAVEVLLPVRPGANGQRPAVVLATRDPAVLRRFEPDGEHGPRWIEGSVEGRVILPWNLDARRRLELIKLRPLLAADVVILDARSRLLDRGPAMILIGILLLVGAGLVGLLPAAPPAGAVRPAAGRRPVAGTLARHSTREVEARDSARAPAVSTGTAPGVMTADTVRPRRDLEAETRTAIGMFIGDPDAPDRPLFPDEEASPFEDAATHAGSAPAVAEARPRPSRSVSRPPDEAEVRRRLFDYSSVATVSKDELLGRFRFVTDKVQLLEQGLRAFPFKGRPQEMDWDDLTLLRAYRCPNLAPWYSLLVAELEARPRPPALTRPPLRVVLRTTVDLGGEGRDLIQNAEDVLRSFMREVILRAPALVVEPQARAWVVSGQAPPQMASLRLLAEHDARWPG